MQIHVVRQGESIYSIAQTFNTTAAQIISSNQLENPNDLVIGQALVIPITGSYYFVQSGDSLYTIARRFGTTAQRLAEINNISLNTPLTVGLRLYIPPIPRREAEFNAYVEPRGTSVSPNLEREARIAAPHLTYLSPFSYQVQRDGTLKPPLLGNFPTIAQENNNVLAMVITNLENDAFSSELGEVILNNTDIQNKLFSTIEKTARAQGFRDIHFDFESLRGEDREAYTNFLRRAKERFSPQGWQISIALAPKTSATQTGKWYEAHDYKAQGAVVDWLLIMTYEWGYRKGLG